MIRSSRTFFLRVTGIACAMHVLGCLGGEVGGETGAKAIQFNRQIRPILAENCFACHGPDKNKRKAGLRLDRVEEATSKLESGDRAIVPGDVEQSKLLKLITAQDEEDRMPPQKSGKQLTKAQINLLRDWIAQGAPWQEH